MHGNQVPLGQKDISKNFDDWNCVKKQSEDEFLKLVAQVNRVILHKDETPFLHGVSQAPFGVSIESITPTQDLSSKKLIVIRGPLGVGKTTISKLLANSLVYNYLSLDKIIDDNNLSANDGIPLENFIKSNEIVFKSCVSDKINLLCGCFYYKDQVEDLKSKFRGNVLFITLFSSLKVCIERDSKREKVFGKESAEFVFSMVDNVKEGYYIDNEVLTVSETLEKVSDYINQIKMFS